MAARWTMETGPSTAGTATTRARTRSPACATTRCTRPASWTDCSRRRPRAATSRAGVTEGAASGLPEEALQERPRGVPVHLSERRARLVVIGLELEHLAIHGGGPTLEPTLLVDSREDEVRFGVRGLVLHDSLRHLLGAALPLRVPGVGPGQLQPRLLEAPSGEGDDRALQGLDGVPVLLLHHEPRGPGQDLGLPVCDILLALHVGWRGLAPAGGRHPARARTGEPRGRARRRARRQPRPRRGPPPPGGLLT